MGKNIHVVKTSDGWGTRREGASKIGRNFNTQAEAEKSAKKSLANSGGGEAVIHGRYGKIRDKDTVPPANDPFPPRDTKF